MAHTAYSCLHVRERICKPNRASLNRCGDVKKRNAHSAAPPDIAADLTSQGSGKFWSAGLVFHDGGRRFRVSQNFALRINHCSPGGCGLPLLWRYFLVVVLRVVATRVTQSTTIST